MPLVSLCCGVTRRMPQPMSSPVNWALLGLVIERESYAYELAQRFQSIYRNVISLSSTSHVYTALGVLQGRSLVEQVPSERAGRQPKPCYRATALGVESYGDWLVGYAREDRRRQVMLVLGLSALAGSPQAVLGILERYEQAWVEPAETTELFAIDSTPAGLGGELIARILSERNELTTPAKLAWVSDARAALEHRLADPAGE
jgi:DNA-binding PadR family transcriptional regulator